MINLEKIDIAELCEESARDMINNGFSNQSFGEFISLVHSELSEALEEFRNHKDLNEVYYTKNAVDEAGVKYQIVCDKSTPGAKPEGIPVELADAVLRITHFCGEHNIDLAGALREKFLFNKTRPQKHGNKKI